MDELIKWIPDMETGIERIDLQHKTLLNIINRLQRAIDSQVDRAGISLIFGQLASYTKFHFKAEEMVIAQVDSGGAAHHHEIHKNFVNQLREYEKKFRAGQTDIVVELLAYLKEWLIDHIIREDCKSLGIKKKSIKVNVPVPKSSEMNDWEWVFSELDKKRQNGN